MGSVIAFQPILGDYNHNQEGFLFQNARILYLYADICFERLTQELWSRENASTQLEFPSASLKSSEIWWRPVYLFIFFNSTANPITAGEVVLVVDWWADRVAEALRGQAESNQRHYSLIT